MSFEAKFPGVCADVPHADVVLSRCGFREGDARLIEIGTAVAPA